MASMYQQKVIRVLGIRENKNSVNLHSDFNVISKVWNYLFRLESYVLLLAIIEIATKLRQLNKDN